MWNEIFRSIARHHIGTTRVFMDARDQQNITQEVGDHVLEVIDGLPWYFLYPLRIYAFGLSILGFLLTGEFPTPSAPEKRDRFFQRVSGLPFYGLLTKLIRTLSFMKLYDLAPRTTE